MYETFSSGAVVTIQARDTNGNLTDVWSTPSPTYITSARIFRPPLYLSININLAVYLHTLNSKTKYTLLGFSSTQRVADLRSIVGVPSIPMPHMVGIRFSFRSQGIIFFEYS